MAGTTTLRKSSAASQAFTVQRENELWQMIWKKRRDALLQCIVDKAAFLKSFEVSTPQVQTLRSLLTRLHSFGQGQFDFFYGKFAAGQLAESDTYPAEFVFHATLDQISYDVEVVERAADQRLNAAGMMGRRLKEADQLALKVVRQAQGYLPPLDDRFRSTTTVVTYFQKMSSIRVIPYANVAMIGIPYTAVDEPFDLLAIPHEVGHYLFWHGKDPATGEFLHRQLTKALSNDIPSWCKVWLEESFADAFAAMAAGPLAAYSLMGTALRQTTDGFITSDYDHVVPVIRPRVALKALKERDTPELKWGDWITPLNAHWDDHAKRHAKSMEFKVKGRAPIDANSALHVNAVKSAGPLDELLKEVFKSLVHVTADDWNPAADPNKADSLYASFEANFTNKTGQNWITDLPQPDPLTDDKFDWNNFISNAFPKIPRSNGTAKIAAETWEPVFLADGWTTEPNETPWPK